MFTLPSTTGNVGEMLSRAHAQDKLANRMTLRIQRDMRFNTWVCFLLHNGWSHRFIREQIVTCLKWVVQHFELRISKCKANPMVAKLNTQGLQFSKVSCAISLFTRKYMQRRAGYHICCYDSCFSYNITNGSIRSTPQQSFLLASNTTGSIAYCE